jgi:glycosyltransferase involved in cell wall biosynthesis
MKISLLSHNLSTNALGRAHVLARLLCQDHEVEIVGPAPSGEIWAPLRDDDSVAVRVLPKLPPAAMAAEVSGDLLYSVKELPESLGVALEAQRQRPRPLIADIDDWELGFRLESIRAMFRSRFRDETKWVARMLLDVHQPHSLWRAARAGRLAARADAITVSSTWLAKRFGGTVIEHARDTSVLDPSLFDRRATRDELSLSPSQTVIVFLGSARRHKGLQTVVDALDLLGRDDIIFLTVGGSTGLPDRPYIRSLGPQPVADLPRFLSAADLVVLAQDSSPATKGQMPAKIYDAMSMGRPLIVTDVSDLRSTVEGCGLVVTPGDTPALADAITWLADHPEQADALGEAGRRRAVEQFSEDVIRPRLLALVDATVASFRQDGSHRAA